MRLLFLMALVLWGHFLVMFEGLPWWSWLLFIPIFTRSIYPIGLFQGNSTNSPRQPVGPRLIEFWSHLT